MAYRVLMELLARPDNIPEWLWNEPASNKSYSTGGKAWTAKLNTNDLNIIDKINILENELKNEK